MMTAAFWRATFERAARTAAQTLVSLWLVGDVALNALTVNWGEALGVGLGAALVSVLMSVAASGASPATGPSFGTETPVPASGESGQSGQANWWHIAVVVLLGLILLVLLVSTNAIRVG